MVRGCTYREFPIQSMPRSHRSDDRPADRQPIAKPHALDPPTKLETTESSPTRSVLDLLTSLNERVATGSIEELGAMATGFVPLDKTLGGGVRPGELTLIGGAQGTGKTTMAMQMARNMAAFGQSRSPASTSTTCAG